MTIYLRTYFLLDKYRRCIPALSDACIAILFCTAPLAAAGIEPFKIDINHKTILISTTIYIGMLIALKLYGNILKYAALTILYLCIFEFFCGFLDRLSKNEYSFNFWGESKC